MGMAYLGEWNVYDIERVMELQEERKEWRVYLYINYPQRALCFILPEFNRRLMDPRGLGRRSRRD